MFSKRKHKRLATDKYLDEHFQDGTPDRDFMSLVKDQLMYGHGYFDDITNKHVPYYKALERIEDGRVY